MNQLLLFEGVTLRRGGRILFENIDLELNPGDALQLAGPNGSGKSSLIRLAAGLLDPEQGIVTRSPAALADDGVALDRELPLGRALAFWGHDCDDAMAVLDIAKLAMVPVRWLSSGQLKRASLARVAASAAPLWLLDEPLNALDADGVERLAGLIARHRSAGGAVIAASHQNLGGEWRRLELGR